MGLSDIDMSEGDGTRHFVEMFLDLGLSADVPSWFNV
jgi:hypothetical protein